jgi:adenylylsulfate kinase
MKILIMGLPGAGKTTLAEPLVEALDATWFNADRVREEYDDWDFSDEGRIRQANRMKTLCDQVVKNGGIAVADFVAPTPKARQDFEPDFLIWVDTIAEGRFEDTNKIFVEPTRKEVDWIVRDWDWEVEEIVRKIRKVQRGQ